MTVGQYKEITELVYDDLTPVAYTIEMISIYDDIDPAEVRKLPASEMRARKKLIKDEINSTRSDESVSIDGTELYKKDFSDLRLGEFIDIDSYLIAGEIDKMLAVLYRKRTGGLMEKYEYEPYDKVNVDYRATKFLDVDASKVIGIVKEYSRYRNQIIQTYQSLFGVEDEDEILTEDDVMTESERKMMAAQELHGQFAWEALILFLCNDDITKWDQVTDLHLVLAFNIASYRKSVAPNRN